MFIKKDTRKIPDILNDENDEREELHLGRRWSRSFSHVPHGSGLSTRVFIF